MKHVLLSNSHLDGVEYGILRDFEDEIVRITHAERVEAPKRSFPQVIDKRLQHGTRYAGLRKLVPKTSYAIEADVLWVVLMGPENFTLDLFDGWDRYAGIKLLYIFDTFECHLQSIKRVLAATDWELTFTAFHGAKKFLEANTGRTWHLVHQGVNLDRFKPAEINRKVIDFCSYGRQMDHIHRSLREYCLRTKRYYDFNTTIPELNGNTSCRDSYQKYAWHLAHSVFNFCWPLNLTHPHRVRTFSPISPRYFEAAASGNVILGKAPTDPAFAELFGADAVIAVDHNNGDLTDLWDGLWRNRDRYLQAALERRTALSHQWSWESRILEILRILELSVNQRAVGA